MQKKLTLKSLAVLAALLSTSAFAQTAAVVKIDGSSTVYPITEVAAEEFQINTKNKVKVTVGISGTGGGFKKLCRNEVDVANASRPISTIEMEACAKAGVKYVEVPVAFDALTVVVNSKNTILKQITVEELKKMWEPAAQGKVLSWKDVNPAYPDQKLKLYGPGSDSGTFDYFTEAVVGKAKSSRGDYTASEDDNVLVQGISRDVSSIGYFGYAYYVENKHKLRAIPVVNKQGKAVSAAPENVANGTYNPLSRPLFLYVNANSLNKPEVKQFMNFYLDNAINFAKEVKYIGLSQAAYKIAKEHIQNNKFGTAYGGHSDVGLTIDEVLKREKKM